MAGKPIKLNVADSQIMALRALKDLNKRLIIVETVCGFQEKWEGIKDRLQAVSKALDGIYKCDGLAAILLLAVRGVRARSARISIISLFHVSITLHKLQEYHSYRSLIPQENHSKINPQMHTRL